MHCGQAFNEAGVAFEPFHLKKEREEGYFDADGNYIQYKLDEVKDAWLDSLSDGTYFTHFLLQSNTVYLCCCADTCMPASYTAFIKLQCDLVCICTAFSNVLSSQMP